MATKATRYIHGKAEVEIMFNAATHHDDPANRMPLLKPFVLYVVKTAEVTDRGGTSADAKSLLRSSTMRAMGH